MFSSCFPVLRHRGWFSFPYLWLNKKNQRIQSGYAHRLYSRLFQHTKKKLCIRQGRFLRWGSLLENGTRSRETRDKQKYFFHKNEKWARKKMTQIFCIQLSFTFNKRYYSSLKKKNLGEHPIVLYFELTK